MKEFTTSWLDKFPVIYDTKCMANSLGLFNKTDLKYMAQQFFESKKFSNFVQFEFDPGFKKYKAENMLHEAGFDSYLTGICFANMLKFVQSQNLLEF